MSGTVALGVAFALTDLADGRPLTGRQGMVMTAIIVAAVAILIGIVGIVISVRRGRSRRDGE
jgi:hypothetical protein